ncbi:hypothetical protein VB602_22675 [Vibrio parahaemolyticus]|uniref:hypothetical protein n=1 Tax=Vibrio TaxID=662 RepID=UPI00193FDFDE|nr:hypothetical protein [Vibrio parahaemolyticus]EGR1345586.1 hypothetical protein [Vibrio parahaemolyticus]EIC2575764.1 hypothetical protein [Vibrio parahaemolyticus]EID0039437.1 hypothetical protein [Vibrio parahaemolyticus]MBM4914685.1 hypothetical protein [Vibrio parahaemolyticus]MEA5239064.1 hypothetical protein [Vibrio parahaemolyticus]
MESNVKKVVAEFESLSVSEQEQALRRMGITKTNGKFRLGRYRVIGRGHKATRSSGINIDFAPVPGRRCPTCGK